MRAEARFSRVVLPAPLGPRTTHRSSSSTRHDRSWSRSAPPRVTVARSTSMTRSGSAGAFTCTIQSRRQSHPHPPPARLPCRAARGCEASQGAEEGFDNGEGDAGTAALLHEDGERDVALPADDPGVRVGRVVVVLGRTGLAVDRVSGYVGEGVGGTGRDRLTHHGAQGGNGVGVERGAVRGGDSGRRGG